jgi:glyoxylase-like metal-dependent hydrolase (beta-lactamase superfamily II)
MKAFDRMIGEIRVTRVEELAGDILPAKEWFPQFNAEELAPHLHWLEPHHYDSRTGNMNMSIHSWVLRTGGKTILIDTCTGNHKDRVRPIFNQLDTPYLERLRAAGVDPNDVDLVMCTHLHTDHVGWNTRLENGRWVPTFPNAKYLMSSTDYDHYFKDYDETTVHPFLKGVYEDSISPVIEAGLATMVDGTEDLVRGLRMRQTPGHTPGHIAIELESAGERALFSGDVLHSPMQVPLWHWLTSVCDDPVQAVETRKALLSDCCEHGRLLLPAHFAHPHGGYVREGRDGSFELQFENDEG